MKGIKIFLAMVSIVLTSLTGKAEAELTAERVHFMLDIPKSEIKSNGTLAITPYIITDDSLRLDLPGVKVYGKRKYINMQRHGNTIPAGERIYKAGECPRVIDYNYQLPRKITSGKLMLETTCQTCCHHPQTTQRHIASFVPPVKPEEWQGKLPFVAPALEGAKTRDLHGSAFIDFPVNKTFIRPDYRRNAVELSKIRATIDSVRMDKDVQVNGIFLTGYASPEGSYANNVRLAKGRTEALKNYIEGLYPFPASQYHTASVPEDWAGLADYVQNSDLRNKEALLAVISSDTEPDSKEQTLRKSFPKDYAILLTECYPALRHCDYVIKYTIRNYNTLEEIKSIYSTRPGNLSAAEFWTLAQSYAPGSADYRQVLETAAACYPDNETCQLNAASAALEAGDLTAAEKYLSRAGKGRDAQYDRAALLWKQGKINEAKEILNEIK